MNYSLPNIVFAWTINLFLVVPALSQSSIGFTSSGLQGVSLNNPTSLQFGPDNRLYVSQQNGTIYAYTIQHNGPNDYRVTNTETILLIKNIPNHNDDGTLNPSVTSRQVTGILVKGTASNPVLYVSSSDPRIGGGGTAGDLNLDTNSGIISKLTWNGASWDKIDLVIGLPRSEENHAVNGMQLDEANNILYLAIGGHTNAGAPSNNFAFLTEYALSAAILSIDLGMIQTSFGGSYILPTLDDPTRANTGSGGADENDPFGGNDGLNQAKLVVGGPVQIHSPGYRNSYDLVITKSPGKADRMYTIDNGPNGGWGGHPDQEGAFGDPLTTNVTNNYVVGEPGSTGPGPNDAKVSNRDNLHLVSKPGMTPIYGGHPNPIRANPSGAGLYWYDNLTSTAHFELNPTVDWPPVPLSMANPVEGDFRNPGVNDGALYTWPSSTNGIVEYTSDKFFNGAMVGDLLTASFDGTIYRIKLTADGTAVDFVEPMASGFGSIPLDVTAQGVGEVFEGTVWAVTYGSSAVTVFEPQGSWQSVTTVDSSTPIARHENAFVEANGKFYLIGGRETTTINIYDPSLKIWTTGAQLPFKMHHFQAATRQGKIYVIGAYQGFYTEGNVGNTEFPVANIYIYDPAANTWSVGAAIPRPRGSAGLVLHNDEFYLIGGIVNGHANGWVTWVDKYNPTTNQWTELADAPRERDHFQASLINGKIYLTGGRKTNGAGNVFGVTIPEVDVYDIALGTWETLPAESNVITPRAGTASVVLNNEIYLLGGESLAQSLAHNQCEIFDPVTKTWRTGPAMITGRHGTGAIVHNNAIFIAAGSANRGGGPVLSSMETYLSSSACSGDINNFSLDDDGDGYSNGDETLNGTNPCSAASVPNDFDGDFLSDKLDDDDDNDGILDTVDLFALDASNGMNTSIPLNYPFLNGDPGFGLFGLGFTGLMANQIDKYSDLYDPDHPDLIMGGAVGIATVPASAGDAKTNDQEYAFQFGFKINPAAGVFTVKSKLQGTPFFNGIAVAQLKDQSQGIFIGTGDQDNYLKVTLAGNFGTVGINVYGENGGTAFINDFYPVSGILTSGILFLYIEVNQGAGTANVYYQTGTDPNKIQVGTAITLPAFFGNLLNGTNAMATGIIASSGTGPSFSASWDFMSINTSSPFVKDNSPTTYNRFVGNPTPPFTLDLKKIFDDNEGVANLSFQVVSVESNTFIDSHSITDGILTINFIGSELGSAKVLVRATDNDDLTADYEFLMQIIPQPSPFFRLNAGGPAFTSWIEDKYFSSGFSHTTTVSIANTSEQIIYKTERWGNFTYQIPVPETGYYRVNLHFAEIYHGIENNGGIGARVFHVNAEGSQRLTNYDIIKEAGGPAIAIIEKLDSVYVSDGFLTLQFIAVVDNAKISAIELSKYTLAPELNSAPIIENPGDRHVYEGGNLSLQIIAFDFNFGDILTYSATGLPASLSINPNTGLISGTIEVNENNYPVSVTVSDGKGGSAQAEFIIKVVQPINYSLRLNSGGPKLTYGAEVWEADRFFLNGKVHSNPVDITNTVKDEIYQTERFESRINYEIPMPGPGRFNITLHFAEIFYNVAGSRVFNLDIESGQGTLSNYDIFQVAGGANLAITESFTVNVTDGLLSLAFTPVTNQAKISGMEISACVNPSVASFTPSKAAICIGESATLTVNGSLGSAQVWNLYTESCGGTLVDSNTTGVFVVSPTASTMYYVRGEGGCIELGNCTSLNVQVNPSPDATITPAGPVCNTDAAFNLIAATSGGTWSGNGITDGAAGTFNPATAGGGNHEITYTLTVGGCTSVDTETISVDPAPDATITPTGPFCDLDLALNLTAATGGGTWSGTGITDGAAGTFDPAVAGQGDHVITYTITAGACTSIDTETIKVIKVQDAVITAAGPLCQNAASVNLSLSSGTPGGTWTGNGITDGALGTFSPATAGPGDHEITYTYSAGSCTTVDTEMIHVDVFSDATITPAGPFCPADAAVNLAAASGGGTWSGPGITNASAGTFNPSVAGAGSHIITHTIVSGSCSSSDTETIVVKAVNTGVTVTGNTMTASAAGAVYQWVNCDGNTIISGETGRSYTPTASGMFAVRVTENGCTVASSCVNLIFVGVDERLSEKISVYPNPARSKLTVTLPVATYNISVDITDASGRSAIQSYVDYGDKVEMDTHSLSPGMYILKIKAPQMLKTVKLIIN